MSFCRVVDVVDVADVNGLRYDAAAQPWCVAPLVACILPRRQHNKHVARFKYTRLACVCVLVSMSAEFSFLVFVVLPRARQLMKLCFPATATAALRT